MAFGDFFLGSPASGTQIPTISPQQQGVKSAVNQQALNMLQGLGGNKFNFEPIAQQARTQFQTQTIPGLAERFTSLGGGSQRSSAFQGALGQAGAGLEESLAALQSQYGLHQQGLEQNLLKSLLAFGLSPEVQTQINPEEPGFIKNLIASYGPQAVTLLGTLLGGLFGGPVGATAGGTLGSAAGSFLKPSQTQQPSLSATLSPFGSFPNYSSLIQNVLKGS